MPHEYIAPTRDEIAVGAYHVWEKESRPLSRQKQNWIEAEAQLTLFHHGLEANPSTGQNSISARNKSSMTVQTALMMPGRGKSSKPRQPRVLVVDDEPPATQLLGGLLRRHGYLTAQENDSTKALQIAHRFQPDILLLDLHMPWMDGHQVAAAFASDNSLSRVPIIYITHDPLDLGKSTDSIPILVKPFSTDDLFARLEEAISKSV